MADDLLAALGTAAPAAPRRRHHHDPEKRRAKQVAACKRILEHSRIRNQRSLARKMLRRLQP